MVESVIKLVKISLKVGEAVWFYARSLWLKVTRDDILFLASGLAFNGVLTMIPLLLLSASALGIFLNSSEIAMEELNHVLNNIFPSQPFADNIRVSISNVVVDMITYRTSLGVVGVLVLVWTGTALFDALRSILHTVYRIEKSKTLLRSLLQHVGFVVLVFVLFIASSASRWVVFIIDSVITQIPQLEIIDVPWKDAIPSGVAGLLTSVMFYVIYRYIPDMQPPRIAGIISTVTTTILWLISARLFALYLQSFSAIGKIYGSYAFILVMLIWIYYSSLVFIFGAMVGQVYWERLKLKEAGTLQRWV